MLRLNPDEKGPLRNKGPSKASSLFETFEKCSFSFKFKEGENFNHRHT